MNFAGNVDIFQTMTSTPRTFPWSTVTSVKGEKINVKRLAADYHLILITLKSVPCPVCPQLLCILNLYGLDPEQRMYVDPFTKHEYGIEPSGKKFFRLLLRQDAYFIVICPGSNAEVAEIQRKTPFMDYPFVAGEQALALGQELKLTMSDDELWPAILEVERDTLAVQPIHIGRSPGQYFHRFLLERLINERCEWEMQGVVAMRDAYTLIDQLKRKIEKCQGKKLATWILTLSSHVETLVPSTADFALSEVSSDMHELPPEILNLILSFASDTTSLVKVARTSRLFYTTVCNILLARLRRSMSALRCALPQKEGEVMLEDEMDVVSMELDRWTEHVDGVGYRELERRVEALKELVVDVTKWTKQWTSRRMTRRPAKSTINSQPCFTMS